MPTKANFLMKSNVQALLTGRHLTREDLSKWCRREVSWASKILGDPGRWFPMKYWDRISDFFGVDTYQLIQPGISALTERRQRDRRSIQDRRLRNIAGEPHRSAISDHSLIHEVLNLDADDRLELVRLLALRKRRGIDVPNTAALRSVPGSTDPVTHAAGAVRKSHAQRPRK